MSGEELAVMLLEASANSLEERFLASLPTEARGYYREAIQMRVDFLIDVQRMLTSITHAEVLLYADRVRSNAVEVAYRWGMYQRMLQRYAELEVSPVHIEVPNEPVCGDKSTEGGTSSE